MADQPVRPAWAQWGAELRRLREQAGKTQRQLSRAALLSKSTLSALETAARTPKRTHAEALDTALSTSGVLSRLWTEVSGQGDLPDWWRSALVLEQRSAEIWEYDPLTIPGLLQTEGYAREMIASGCPRSQSGQAEHEVRQRVERLPQLLDRRAPPRLKFIVGEQALYRPVGGQRVMEIQLDRIIGLVVDCRLSLQILPWAATPAWASLPLRINIVDERRSVAYLEHLLGGSTQDDSSIVTSLISMFGDLAAESLPTRQSLDLIRKVRAQCNGARAATAISRATASK